jgi:hypothetical protein
MPDRPKQMNPIRARGGVLMPAMRTVLIVSVILAIVALAWVYLRAPAATEPDMSAKVSAIETRQSGRA